MAQGKLKVKAKLPNNAKVKKNKGTAVSKRTNRPIQPKKKKFKDQHNIKQAITKMVNKSVEAEIRAKADGSSSSKTLSKAQQAVAQHHANL